MDFVANILMSRWFVSTTFHVGKFRWNSAQWNLSLCGQVLQLVIREYFHTRVLPFTFYLS